MLGYEAIIVRVISELAAVAAVRRGDKVMDDLKQAKRQASNQQVSGGIGWIDGEFEEVKEVKHIAEVKLNASR